MDTIKILIVDDHAVLRDGIRALLNLYDDLEIVDEASDGREAIQKATELNPEIILMDIAIPEIDGLEVTRRIKKKNPSIKVLALTQYDNKEYIVSAIKAGVSGYVPKKALGADLVSAIRAIHNGESFLYPSSAAKLIQEYLRQAEEEPYDRLTNREREILKMIADGHTSREIANKLFLSIKTVYGHRTKIMEKLDIHNRTELIKYAIRNGLISIDSSLKE